MGRLSTIKYPNTFQCATTVTATSFTRLHAALAVYRDVAECWLRRYACATSTWSAANERSGAKARVEKSQNDTFKRRSVNGRGVCNGKS